MALRPMDLETVINDIAEVLKAIDSSAVRFKSSRPPFKEFQPGVGPCPEPQLVKLIAEGLNRIPRYGGVARTRRTPDLLIEKRWAIEIKIARPFGDNGKLAENWSVNLLHPYPGNTSLLGDCLKLIELPCSEQKAVIALVTNMFPLRYLLNLY